jgi:ComF family protein
MQKILTSVKKFLLDIFFPPFCLGCQKEGTYLCEDCFSLIEVLERQFCPGCGKISISGRTCRNCQKHTKLNGLFSAVSYQNFLVKKIIRSFKYAPYIKELAGNLSFLIITHFKILDKIPEIDFIIPVPLSKKKLKKRGFNQAEEISKGVANYLGKPVINNILLKIKETPSQTDLNQLERKENVKGVFSLKLNSLNEIRGKKILLIDDIFTTGSTMEECARILKEIGKVREVWGAVVAREE